MKPMLVFAGLIVAFVAWIFLRSIKAKREDEARRLFIENCPAISCAAPSP